MTKEEIILELGNLKVKKSEAISKQDYIYATILRDKTRELKEKLNKINNDTAGNKPSERQPG